MQNVMGVANLPPQIERKCGLFQLITRAHAKPPPTERLKEIDNLLGSEIEASHARNGLFPLARWRISASESCYIHTAAIQCGSRILSPRLDPSANMPEAARGNGNLP